MHPTGLARTALVLLLGACGPTLPGLERASGSAPDGGADSWGEFEGGVRVLSDVNPPRASDVSSERGVERAAPTVTVEVASDAPAEGRSSSDEAVADAPSWGGSDAAPSGRDGPSQVGDGSQWGGDAPGFGSDACGECRLAANHLLLTEIVTRPNGAELIEIMNPTPLPVVLSNYLISDSHLYYLVASGNFSTSSGSDFAARFPAGSVLGPGEYAVVALGNASGGTASFLSTYGRAPDFELRPVANQATDDPTVPNMEPIASSSIGANASLTDGGESVVLFFYAGGNLVSDVDYVFYGTPSTPNPVIDKTGIVVANSGYRPDTMAAAQHQAPAPGDGTSIHRCDLAESSETQTHGNGLTGHDETSEDARVAFVLGPLSSRTPGGPPPAGVCGP